jgi:GMP synthase-like glutamine amidotransferase
MTSATPFKIAILVNSPPGNEFWHDVRQSWTDAFNAVARDANIDFYDPVHKLDFPNPSEYNLIVLSGGKADASSSDLWVLGVLSFVRSAVRDSPKTKILGICWGHQAVLRALGGSVQPVTTGPIVCTIPSVYRTESQGRTLTIYVTGRNSRCQTDPGRKELFPFRQRKWNLCKSYQRHYIHHFFAGSDLFKIQRVPQFHVREVGQPAPEFIHLAENHECFVNPANTILTFQGHPEVHSTLAKKMLVEEDDVYNGNSSEEKIQEELLKLEQPTDGVVILQRVIEWAKE